MFEAAIYEAASKMNEVKRIEYVGSSVARVSFFSHSRKSTYSYEFILCADGVIATRPMANGPYLCANAPMRFVDIVKSYL